MYHKNEFGFTRKCECHGAVHLLFGTVSLLLTRQQCRDFTTYISEAVEAEYHVVSDHDERCIYIPSRDNCLMFTITYNELKRLADLLQQTLLMIEIEDTLAF